MNYYTLILTVAACMVSCSTKPSGLLPAPLVAAPLAYPAPVVASRSAQVVQSSHHTLAAPYIAAPFLAARYAYAAPAVAAPLAARYAYPAAAPLVAAPARFAAPLVAAPARFATPAVAAPLVAAPPALAAPAVASALPAPYPYYI